MPDISAPSLNWGTTFSMMNSCLTCIACAAYEHERKPQLLRLRRRPVRKSCNDFWEGADNTRANARRPGGSSRKTVCQQFCLCGRWIIHCAQLPHRREAAPVLGAGAQPLQCLQVLGYGITLVPRETITGPAHTHFTHDPVAGDL